MRRQWNSDCRLINIIVHSTHYIFPDWPKAYSEFSKSARGTFSSCRLYNNQVKDTQGHGYSCHVYDRGAWFLSVIMSSSLALCCLPSVKKQKHDFQVCFVDRARHRKNSWRQGLTNTKRSTKVAKELFADYVKAGKTERTWGKERVGRSFENILCSSEKERIRSMYNKTIIRCGFCDIQNNQGLGKGYQPQPSASADNRYLELNYSGYHKNLIQ